MLAYLIQGGMLSVRKAERLFHTTELRRIVSRLRRKGYAICGKPTGYMTDDGRKVIYNEYFISDEGSRIDGGLSA